MREEQPNPKDTLAAMALLIAIPIFVGLVVGIGVFMFSLSLWAGIIYAILIFLIAIS